MPHTPREQPFGAQVRELLRDTYGEYEPDVVEAAEQACDELEADPRRMAALGYHAVYCAAGLQAWEHLGERINALTGLSDKAHFLRERRADRVALELRKQDATAGRGD